MKNSISHAEETVGLMLAEGFTKKEVATQLHKSIRTVDRQTDDLYKKTNSRNLADITRFMVNRYTGIPVEDVLIHAMHDLTVLVAAAFLTWCALQPEMLEKLNSALSTVATFLTK
jgi:DNA-binding CsgD family transcriptional regulator